MRSVVVTADDFGMDPAINEAVEIAHREGVLTSASLMVTGHAVADAVRRARAMPRLGVGLHLVLVDGRPALPPQHVPALVGRDGRFPADPLTQGLRLLSRQARRQLRAELRAQFVLFGRTGLRLDHVDGHHHFHLHPAVQGLLIELAREFRACAVRVPLEPPVASGAVAKLDRWVQNRYARRLRGRLEKAGLTCNDRLIPAGASAAQTMGRVLGAPPEGLTEIYLHPVARAWQPGDPWREDHDGCAELQALRDPALRRGVAARPGVLATFGSAVARR